MTHHVRGALLMASVVVLSSCVERRSCGPAPRAPGWVANVFLWGGGPLACLAVDDYSKITLYRAAVETWTSCIEGAL